MLLVMRLKLRGYAYGLSIALLPFHVRVLLLHHQEISLLLLYHLLLLLSAAQISGCYVC